jgi:uncharacterized protein (UPF0332 family)
MYDEALLLEKLEQMIEELKMMEKFLKTTELALEGEDYHPCVPRCYSTMFFMVCTL